MTTQKRYAVDCMNGNHTFIIHETEVEALTAMRDHPERYDCTEMITDRLGNHLHREMYEETRAYLKRASVMISAASQVFDYSI